MKKHILTCFLAYLCLYGSTLTAQVADPPGADFLHRSRPTVPHELRDIHRGEETRSDSLPPLVDPGGDSASPSPAVIFVETRRSVAIDTLEFLVWDPYLTEKDLPLPQKDRLALTAGNMYEGSRETARGQWDSPPLTGYSRMSMRYDRYTYFDRFLISPGDSVRVRLDFENARMLFSGPDADKFRIQYELASAFENFYYDLDPTMLTAKKDYWGYSDRDSLMIRSVIEANSSVRRKMEFITPGPEGLAYLERYFAMDWSNHPGFKIIERYRGRLDPAFLDILYADLLGRILYDRVHKFSIYYHRDGAHQQFFEEKIAAMQDSIPSGAAYSSHYPNYLYEKLAVISALSGEPFSNLLGDLPQEISDRVYATFIIKNYRKFRDSNKQFELALEQIRTPWITEEISRLYSAQRIGDPLASVPLIDRSGEEYMLSGDRGKIMLINFWLPGCHASSGAYESLIRPAEAYFKDDPEIKFVHVSHDRDSERWLRNVEEGKYSDPESLNLNAPGQPDPFLKHYDIHYFPTYMAVDKKGNVINIGNMPRTVDGLIAYLKSLKEGTAQTQPKRP